MSEPTKEIKIEITINQEVTKTVTVELPYYYYQNLESDHSDSKIYGKIEETKHTCIQENYVYGGKTSYEIESEEHNSIKGSGLGCYFQDKHSSTEKEYQEAKKRCQSFIEGL